MNTTNWYERPIDTRAHKGGELGVNGTTYRGGEFLPFYVPRTLMPQIYQPDAFANWCLTHGIEIAREWVDPHSLRAHQRVDVSRALAIPDKVLDVPAIVSQDRYILDGNHRWYDHIRLGLPIMPVFQLALPFEPAIALLFEYTRR